MSRDHPGGPSGRRPPGRFEKKTGDYVSEIDPLGRWSDTLMNRAAIPGEGVTGELRRVVTQDDVLRALGNSIGDKSGIYGSDYVRAPGDEEYQISDVMAELREMGLTNETFLALSERERRRGARELQRRLRRKYSGRDDAKQSATTGPSRDEIKAAIIAWLDRPLVMERPQGSSFHHLLEWAKRTRGVEAADGKFLSDRFQLFVIEHDWAKAFAGSGDFAGGEIPMPYDYTCFEMRISGARVLLLVGPSRDCMLAIGVRDAWSCTMHDMAADGTLRPEMRKGTTYTNVGRPQVGALLALVRAQVRAVCVMLDAEVAEVDVRRAPERLNRQRERQGRTILRDFHVVRLAHRHRVRAADERASPFNENYTRKRLHFRRGHDRHYPNYKVWIKWQLVGDPDLGFVDKEYRL